MTYVAFILVSVGMLALAGHLLWELAAVSSQAMRFDESRRD